MSDKLASTWEPFAKVPEWVLYHPDLSSTAKVVYAVLDRHADKKQHTAFPGHKTIGEMIGRTAQTVARAIRSLEAVGAITVEARYRDGRQTSNLYTLRAQMEPGGIRIDTPDPVRNDTPDPVRNDRAELESEEPEPIEPLAAKTPRRRDPLWDALTELLPAPATRTERGRWNTALRQLREVDATPTQIVERAAEYRRRWPDIDFTPTGLVANWTLLGTPKPGSVEQRLHALRLYRGDQ